MAKTREKDTYIEFSMAGSLENRGKLRELIDKFQFIEVIQIPIEQLNQQSQVDYFIMRFLIFYQLTLTQI